MQRNLPNVALVGFLTISAAFILLNLLTDRSSFWAAWPIWAFGMIAAAVIGQARLAPYRLLGLWLGFGAVLIAGLFVIDVLDMGDNGGWWFFWPLGVWVIGAMAIAGLTVNLLDSVPTSRPMAEVEVDPALPAQEPDRADAATRSATRLPGNQLPTSDGSHDGGAA